MANSTITDICAPTEIRFACWKRGKERRAHRSSVPVLLHQVRQHALRLVLRLLHTRPPRVVRRAARLDNAQDDDFIIVLEEGRKEPVCRVDRVLCEGALASAVLEIRESRCGHTVQVSRNEESPAPAAPAVNGGLGRQGERVVDACASTTLLAGVLKRLVSSKERTSPSAGRLGLSLEFLARIKRIERNPPDEPSLAINRRRNRSRRVPPARLSAQRLSRRVPHRKRGDSSFYAACPGRAGSIDTRSTFLVRWMALEDAL